MKSKNLFDAFDGIDASMILEAEPVKKEVVAMTSRRRIRKPLIFVAAMILCVATLSIGVFAGMPRSVMEPYWKSVFSPKEDTEKKMPFADIVMGTRGETEQMDEEIVSRLDDISSVPEDVTFTGDNDDVMFNVVGVTGAGNAAYIWLELVLSDELLKAYDGDPGYITLWRVTTKINGQGTSMSSGTRFLGSKASLLGDSRLATAEKYATEWSGSAGKDGGAQAALVSRPDNTFCFIYRFEATNVATLSGKELTMNIRTLNRRDSYEASEGRAVLAEGPWELKFTMNFTDSVIGYVLPMAGERFVCDETDPKLIHILSQYRDSSVLEATLTGLAVRISPIFMEITMGYTDTDHNPLATPRPAVVVMADGSRIEVLSDGTSSSIPVYTGIGSHKIHFFFDEPFDHKQAVAIEYGNLVLPLNEETLVQ